MTAAELATRLNKPRPPVVIDVRSAFEYRSGHIPGARHVPFWGALFRRALLPEDRQTEIVLTCEHGPRARLAASQLELLGFSRVVLLEGHMSRWRRDGLPVIRD